jgi:predicted dehydrogenase
MPQTVRFGIIGAGMMGREHIRNIKLFPEAELVALADPTPLSLQHAQQTAGERAANVKPFDSAEAMIADGGLDAVIVASPNHTHRAVLEQVFATPLHILCEKPLCTTVEDARWAAEQAAARPAGVFWTGMEYRFMPPPPGSSSRSMPVASAAGDLSIREHRFPFLIKVDDWNRFSRNTGGTMVEKCCHFFDLMRVITQSEPVRVFCSGAMDVNHLDERYDGATPDIIDNSFTVVDFANGQRAMLDLNMFAEGPRTRRSWRRWATRPSWRPSSRGRPRVLAPRPVRHAQADRADPRRGGPAGAERRLPPRRDLLPTGRVPGAVQSAGRSWSPPTTGCARSPWASRRRSAPASTGRGDGGARVLSAPGRGLRRLRPRSLCLTRTEAPWTGGPRWLRCARASTGSIGSS